MLSIPVTQNQYETLIKIKDDEDMSKLISKFLIDSVDEFGLHIAEPLGVVYKIDDLGWKEYIGDGENKIYLENLAHLIPFAVYENKYKEKGFIFKQKTYNT